MTRIKKLCALVLAVMMVVTAGVISVNAAQSSDSDAVSADTTETGITIHVRMSDGTQPYICGTRSPQTAPCQSLTPVRK